MAPAPQLIDVRRSVGPALEVTNLTSLTRGGMTLLDDVSFAVEAGSLLAVVGPTGAGKTSLANVLAGVVRPAAGTIRLGGQSLSGFNRRGRVGLVPQDDATHPQLSLRRTLQHAAALRLHATREARQERIDEVLTQLRLTHRADTRVGDLSGGERKRANIAVELVGDPDLLVLDEPTSGLDPAFEKSVFATLRTLADAGRTVIAVTHSLQALAVSDRVLFLAPGGGVAFFGTPAEAAAYFDWDEPTDAFVALHDQPAAPWQARFRAYQAKKLPAPLARPDQLDQGEQPQRIMADPPASAAPRVDRRQHLRTLLHRACDLATSDHRTLGLMLAAGPVLGVLLWAVLPSGTLGLQLPPPDPSLAPTTPPAETFGFFIALAVTWLGTAGAVREVVKERHIVRRERAIGVSARTYVAGKVMFLSAVSVLQVVPLAVIALIGQHAPGHGALLVPGALEVVAVIALVGVAGVATGLLVSAWAASSEKAMTVLPVVLIAQLALAGPWANDAGPVISALRAVVPARWAASAVGATVNGEAGTWLVAVGLLLVISVVQFFGVLFLVHHGAAATRRTKAPRASAAVQVAGPPARLDPLAAFSARFAAAPWSKVGLLPLGLSAVLALAAGTAVVGRAQHAVVRQAAAASATPASPATAAPAAPPATPAPSAPTTARTRTAPSRSNPAQPVASAPATQAQAGVTSASASAPAPVVTLAPAPPRPTVTTTSTTQPANPLSSLLGGVGGLLNELLR